MSFQELKSKGRLLLKKDPILLNSFFLILSGIFSSGCGFFFWILAARLYSLEDVGIATALISFLGLAVLFSTFGFEFSIIRFFPEGDRSKVVNTCLVVVTILSLSLGIMFIIFVDFMSPTLSFIKNVPYSLLFVFIGVMETLAAIAGRALVAGRKSHYYFAQNLFLFTRIIFLFLGTSLGALGIFGSFGLSFIAASIFALFILDKYIAPLKLIIDKNFLSKSFKYSYWNYISNILFIAPTLILPIMALDIVGEAETAKYYIAFNIGNLILVVPASLSTSVFVEGSYGNGLRNSVTRAAVINFAILIPGILVILFSGQYLLDFVNVEYATAFDLLRIITLSSLLVSLYYLFISIENVKMNVEIIVILNLIRFSSIIGLSYLLIARYGITGLGYAWVLSYIILSICIIAIGKREHMI